MPKLYSTQTTTNVSNSASTALIPAATNRSVLIVNAPQTNRFTISLLGTAVLDQGITLYPTEAPLILTAAQHGDIVTRAWSAISGTAAQNVTFLSVFEG